MDTKVVQLIRHQRQARHVFEGLGWLLLFVGGSFVLTYAGLRAIIHFCMDLWQ